MSRRFISSLLAVSCLHIAFADAAAYERAAPTDAHRVPPVRIVPQLYYLPEGIVDPTGRFAVAPMPSRVSSTYLCIVDLTHKRVAWVLRTTLNREWEDPFPAFSADGQRLAIATGHGGAFLHLADDTSHSAPWLTGRPLYSPNDEHLVTLVNYGDEQCVEVYDRNDSLVWSIPLGMNAVQWAVFSRDGRILNLEGCVITCPRCHRPQPRYPMRESIDLVIGDFHIESLPSTALDCFDFDPASMLQPIPQYTNSALMESPQRSQDVMYKLLGLLPDSGFPKGCRRRSTTCAMPSPGGTLASECYRSSDGHHVAVPVVDSSSGRSDRIQLRLASDSSVVAEIDYPDEQLEFMGWTSDGAYVIVNHVDMRGESVEYFTAEGALFRSRSHLLPIQGFSDSGYMMWYYEEAGKDDLAPFRCEVWDVRKDASWDTSQYGISVLGFLGDERAIIAQPDLDSVALVDLELRRTVWTTHLPISADHVSWDGEASVLVVHAQSSTISTILSLTSGRTLPDNVPDDEVVWYNPILLQDSRYAIDAAISPSVLSLREVSTGRTIVTCAAITASEWMAYTPDGWWMGSDGALKSFAFYRGTNLLTQAEIDALHQPNVVLARIASAMK